MANKNAFILFMDIVGRHGELLSREEFGPKNFRHDDLQSAMKKKIAF
jgi:hypothetical protein